MEKIFRSASGRVSHLMVPEQDARRKSVGGGLLLMALTAGIIAMSASPQAGAAAITSTWNSGTTGNWTSSGNWTFSSPPATTTFPNNLGGDNFDVRIDGGGAGNSTVNLNTTVTIDTLNVSAGDNLNFNNGQDMTVTGSAIVNNGTVNLNSSGAATDLRLSGASTLSGNGEQPHQ